jgi:hypothetical protein
MAGLILGLQKSARKSKLAASATAPLPVPEPAPVERKKNAPIKPHTGARIQWTEDEINVICFNAAAMLRAQPKLKRVRAVQDASNNVLPAHRRRNLYSQPSQIVRMNPRIDQLLAAPSLVSEIERLLSAPVPDPTPAPAPELAPEVPPSVAQAPETPPAVAQAAEAPAAAAPPPSPNAYPYAPGNAPLPAMPGMAALLDALVHVVVHAINTESGQIALASAFELALAGQAPPAKNAAAAPALQPVAGHSESHPDPEPPRRHNPEPVRTEKPAKPRVALYGLLPQQEAWAKDNYSLALQLTFLHPENIQERVIDTARACDATVVAMAMVAHKHLRPLKDNARRYIQVNATTRDLRVCLDQLTVELTRAAQAPAVTVSDVFFAPAARAAH